MARMLPGMSWDRMPFAARDAERDRLLARWLASEVVPFNGCWAKRLSGKTVRGLADLADVAPLEEAEAAGLGGPGNPGLLLVPTEDGFKRHASRGEIFRAALEVRRGGPAARRAVLFRRYKPVHVHEAGVAALLAIAYTRTDLDRLHLAGARLVEVLGLGADDRLVNAVPTGPSVRFWGLYHAALAARMTALHPRAAGADLVAAVARAFALLPATVLAVPVHEAVALLDGLAERGVACPSLRTVLTVGPPPTAEVRREIGEAAGGLGANGVRVQAVWAPESSRVLWGECRPPSADPSEATYGLHTFPDLEIVEVRDTERGRLAAPGDAGEILLTSLGWRGTVALRLASGAWTAGLATSAVCPNCRRTVPRLAPDVVEAAWQPRVRAGDRTVRVDVRRAAGVLTASVRERLGITSWSLRPVDGVLALVVETADGRTEGLAELARDVGAAVGVVPVVRVSRPAGGVQRGPSRP